MPILVDTPWFTIHSYGFFLSLAFWIGAGILAIELKRRGFDPSSVPLILLVGVSAGLFGARFSSALETPGFWADPVSAFTHRAGLAYLGGFLLAVPAVALATRAAKIPFLPVCDAVAPGLAFGYAAARAGCFLSGDGCYGRPSLLPWAMTFPHGLVSTLAERNADLRGRFLSQFPTLELPLDIPVHPTPLYELALALLVGVFLWRRRLRPATDGSLFAQFAALSAITRLLVEPLRLNREWALGLTQSQAISLTLLFLSSFALLALARWARRETAPSFTPISLQEPQ